MTMMRLLWCFLCVAAMGGCTDSSTGGASAPKHSADPVVMRGEAMYFERIAPPVNAQLQVSLINASLADSPDAIIATALVDQAGAPPIPFELSVDRSALDPRMRYALRASLRDGDGRLWFTSDENHAIAPDDAKPVSIRMKMVANDQSEPDRDAVGEAAPAITSPSSTRFRCGDRIVDTTFADEAVSLRYDDVERVLPRARSASGARYAQDGDEFWTRGEGAILTLSGERSDCVASNETTPWEDAKARGVSIRVVGSEPGWLAEIGSGESRNLRLLLDQGERELLFDAIASIDGAAGVRAEHEGVVAELRLFDEACEDPMSGQAFALRAELTVDGKAYSGCGRRLAK